jgi:hypothetical protein
MQGRPLNSRIQKELDQITSKYVGEVYRFNTTDIINKELQERSEKDPNKTRLEVKVLTLDSLESNRITKIAYKTKLNVTA